MNYFLSDEGMRVELSLQDISDLVFNQREINKDSIKIEIDKIELCLLVKNDENGVNENDLITTLKRLK